MWCFQSFQQLDFQKKGIWADSQYLDFSFKNNWFFIYQTFYKKRSNNLKFNFKVFQKWKFIQDINVTYYLEDMKDAFVMSKVVIKQFLSGIFDIESEWDFRYKTFQKEPDEPILIIPREVIIYWDEYWEYWGEDEIYCNNVCIYDKERLNLLYERTKSYAVKSFKNPLNNNHNNDYYGSFYYLFENKETKYVEIFSKERFEEILMYDDKSDLNFNILEATKKENNNSTYWLLINTWIYWIAKIQRFKCVSDLRDIIETIKRHSIKSHLWFNEFLSFMLKKCLFEFEVSYNSYLSDYDDNLVLLITIQNHLIDNERFIKTDEMANLKNELHNLGWKTNIKSWKVYLECCFFLEEDWNIEKSIDWNKKTFYKFVDNFYKVRNYIEPTKTSLVYKIGNEEPKLVFKIFDDFNIMNKDFKSDIHSNTLKLFYTKNQEYIFYIWTKVYVISKEWDKIYELDLTDYFWKNKTDNPDDYILFLEKRNNRLFIHKQEKSVLILDINTWKTNYIDINGKEIYLKKGTKVEWEVCLKNYYYFEDFHFQINDNNSIEERIRNVELLNLTNQIYLDKLFNILTGGNEYFDPCEHFSTKLWIKWYYNALIYEHESYYTEDEIMGVYENNNLFTDDRNYSFWPIQMLWNITRNYEQHYESYENKIMLQNNYRLHVLIPKNKLFFSNKN